MKRTIEKLQKLRGRTPAELRVRAAQLFAARAERYGLSNGARLLTDEALFKLFDVNHVGLGRVSAESLLEHFRARTSPAFFASFENREETVAELRTRFGQGAEDALLKLARRICEGRFSLLGLTDLDFGSPPDFHLEPVSGKRSPLVHWSRMDELSADLTGDKKIVWELNRCQYLTILGRAYWHTLDERYAQTAVAHLGAWMDQNPPKLGVNWVSSLEVALRAISWLWALYFFKDSPHVQPAFFLRALKYLYLHGRHLETYLSTYSSPNTHLTGEALGLFYLGSLLAELKAAGRWRLVGEQILLEALSRHVRPDGVYFEQSSYYHRYTTDFYTHFYLLARANGTRLAPLLEEKLTALLDHLMYITRPDGTTPLFGDDDGGRLLMLGESAPNDFRAALSTGAAVFSRDNYKYVAGAKAAEETLWLLGTEGLRAFDRLDAHAPPEASRAFMDGGYYVMRDGWTPESNYLLIDCGPHGTLNCGHAHADALSFELAARGRTLLVDPGTYTYTGEPAVRDAFRRSDAHNTLTIDGESSSVPAGTFNWQSVARVSARAWSSQSRFDYFEGTHDGYARLSSPATHERSILFLKDDYWIMRDRVETTGRHQYDLRFHFAADARPVIKSEEATEVLREGAIRMPGLEVAAFGASGAWREEEGWVSLCYGERSLAPVRVFSTEAEGALAFVTFLMPRRVGQEAAQVSEMAAENGLAFEVMREDERDVLMLLKSVGAVEAAGFVSDFAWTWLRFESGSGRLKEMLLLDGQRLEKGGEELFKAAERIASAIVRYERDAVRVDVEGSGQFSVAHFGASRAAVNGEAFAVSGDSPLSFQGRRLRHAASGEVAARVLI